MALIIFACLLGLYLENYSRIAWDKADTKINIHIFTAAVTLLLSWKMYSWLNI